MGYKCKLLKVTKETGNKWETSSHKIYFQYATGGTINHRKHLLNRTLKRRYYGLSAISVTQYLEQQIKRCKKIHYYRYY